MKVLSLSLLSALLVTGGFMIAGDEGQCDAKCATECKACPVTEGMAKLPQLVYKVGDELACCENSAKSMARALASLSTMWLARRILNARPRHSLA